VVPRLGTALRLLRINRVLVRHGLDRLVLATHLYRPLVWLLRALPWNWGPRSKAPRAVRLREALEDLGPLFVKFGQILSTRRDLLPDDIADELARLQDRVAPFPGERARAIMEEAYGRPVGEVFAALDERPLASASIAQVHAARLPDGREVVVKVLRPGVHKAVARDLALLRVLAELAARYWKEARRLRPVEVVAEMEKTLADELDLMREGANAAALRRNFEDSRLLYVPEVHWEYTRPGVLVMERIYGTPISDVPALVEAGIDLARLAEHGVEIFFTQVFRHNFFHADMHPGNIFVAPDGRYLAVDFGIMGTLSKADQRWLAENFLAFFRRDYHKVAEAHVHAGWVGPDTRMDELEGAVRAVCEPIFQRPFGEISFGQLLLRLFQVARRFDMRVQPQLVLLQKTLLNIEGLGRQLYPQLDLWSTARPFLERWMADRLGPRAALERLRENVPLWGERLPELPLLQHQVLSQARDGTLQVRMGEVELAHLTREVRGAGRRVVAAVTGAALTLTAAILASGTSPELGALAQAWRDLHPLVYLAAGAGLGLLVAAWMER
jgi:ubiquinone biosynthesis protein